MKSLIVFVTVRKYEIDLRKDEQDRSRSLLLSTLYSKYILLYLRSLYMLSPILYIHKFISKHKLTPILCKLFSISSVTFLVLWVILFNKNITVRDAWLCYIYLFARMGITCRFAHSFYLHTVAIRITTIDSWIGVSRERIMHDIPAWLMSRISQSKTKL